MAGHTGQSSQLFPVALGRNAQFLATVARSGLARQVEIDLTVKAAGLMRIILFKSQASIFISMYAEQHGSVCPKNMNLRPPWTVAIMRNSFAYFF
jgi:hypothetical protein